MREAGNVWLIGIVAVGFAALVAMYFPQRRHILALARVTFLDALRKKVPTALLVLGIFIIGVSQFFPVFRIEDRLQVVESVCFWSLSTFGMIVSIFVAALSLPNDLSDKTIYTIVTKPVHRGSIILGKVLGMAFVSALILVVMGVVSLAAIRYADRQVCRRTQSPSRLFARWTVGPSEHYIEGDGLVWRDGRTLVNGEYHSAFVWFFPHPMLYAVDGRIPEVLLALCFGPQAPLAGEVLSLYIELRNGDKWGQSIPLDARPNQVWQKPIALGGFDLSQVGRSSAFEVAVGPRKPFEFLAEPDDVTLFVNGLPVQAEKVAPRAEGLSPKRTITWFSRDTRHRAVWVFRGLNLSNLPKTEIEGFGDFKISTGRLGPNYINLHFLFGDQSDPGRFYETTVQSVRDRTTHFKFPARCIRPDGTLRVAVERADKTTYLGVSDEMNFGLYAQQGSFDGNFCKALLVIFAQLVLLSAVAVAGSTAFSAPVSVLFAFFVFFCGNLVDFMRNAATVLSWGTAHVHTHEPPGVLATWWYAFLDKVSDVIAVVMPRMAKVVPDLQQFDVAGNVMAGDQIAWVSVLHACAYFGAYMLFGIVVGQWVFRWKEME